MDIRHDSSPDADTPGPYLPVEGHPDVGHTAGLGDQLQAHIGRGCWELGILGGQLPASARHLALTLATSADWTGHIPDEGQPTWHDLIRQTGLSNAALFQASSQLAGEGWIAIDRRSGQRRPYFRLVLPSVSAAV